jgi:hypothetical protein
LATFFELSELFKLLFELFNCLSSAVFSLYKLGFSLSLLFICSLQELLLLLLLLDKPGISKSSFSPKKLIIDNSQKLKIIELKFLFILNKIIFLNSNILL